MARHSVQTWAPLLCAAPFALAALTALAALAGCGGDDGSSSTASASSSSSSSSSGGEGGAGGSAPMDLTIAFEGRVGDKVFDCGASYPGLGMGATEVKLTDFRLYIHDVRLHQVGGGDVAVELEQDKLWQYQNVALLDFEDKSGSCSNGTVQTNSAIHGSVPAGAYDGISFKLGVPFELNHGDASVAPSPLNLSALFWSWNGGYKFLRADSVPAGGGGPFNLHLGSTDCVPDMGDVMSCDRPNVAEIVLTGWSPATSSIVVDYAAAIAGSDLAMNMGGAPGCMSGSTDPDCAPVFERLGLDITDGSTHPEKQTLFRVE